ncbi:MULTISPECIES: hypothetical protein [unclassified Mesorhizobium]|nr:MULTISPECIES: hypothetical protein [unclassified Mesorhizobium]
MPRRSARMNEGGKQGGPIRLMEIEDGVPALDSDLVGRQQMRGPA